MLMTTPMILLSTALATVTTAQCDTLTKAPATEKTALSDSVTR